MEFLEFLKLDLVGLVCFSLLIFSFLVVAYLLYVLGVVRSDIYRFSDALRVLLRSGKSPEGLVFKSSLLEGVWRRLVGYYAGVLKERDSRNDITQILSSGRGIMEAGFEDQKILEVLCEVLHKTASPEAVFVCVAIKDQGTWLISSSVGISKYRLEDPITLALDKMPLEHREAVYTSPNNGLEFDFRALGVGLSLFVPLKINNTDLFGVVWLGFSELSGLIPEDRKHTLELIVQHAVAAYVKSKERNSLKAVDDKRKEEMFALSHDMKAPGSRAIYAVRELDGLLERHNLYEEQSLAQEIEFALVEQMNLIDKLFNVDGEDFSHTHNKTNLELDVGALLRSRVDAFRIVVKNLGLELSLRESIRVKCRVSRDSLQRILDNLISNSIKYSLSGTIEVLLTAEDSRFRIEVRDQGSGVEPALQKYLFSPKLREVQAKSSQGHRYGLTVVKTLVQDEGGTVGYMPNEPEGSIFYVEFPCTRILPMEAENGNSPQILVIDDDPMVRATHERWLSSLGLRVYGVQTFREALNIMKIKKPNIVITDMMIPGDPINRFLDLVPDDVDVFVVSGRSKIKVGIELKGYKNVKVILEKPLDKKILSELIVKNSSEVNNIARLKVA